MKFDVEQQRARHALVAWDTRAGVREEFNGRRADYAALVRAEARGQVRQATRRGFTGGYARWLQPSAASALAAGRSCAMPDNNALPWPRVAQFVQHLSIVFACRRWFVAVQWGRVSVRDARDRPERSGRSFSSK